MLKSGKVVKQDSMQALLRQISGSQLQLRIRGEFPATLQNMLAHPPQQGQYALRINDYNEVEPALARLREAGCVIEDMHLQQADLEDVFLQVMEGGQ